MLTFVKIKSEKKNGSVSCPPTFTLHIYFENEDVRIRLDLLYYLMMIRNTLYV